MVMAEMTARDAKLVQYLNEAYGKEKELETALAAHIAMTTRAPYKKRLQEHLRETKRHAKDVQRRIKQLGGKAEVVPAPGPEAVSEAASTVMGAAKKAAAAAQGPMHMLRGTGEQEKMLKNAKTEFFNEAEEIATYRAIETLSDTVGDKDTAKLARTILREEERMSKFLERLIPQLTKAVATAEIPAAERNGSRARRRSAAASRRRPRAAASRPRAATSGSAAASRARSSSGTKARASSSRSSSARTAGGTRKSSSGRAARSGSASRSARSR
jgi:ferritin-like metal-binding protein YciE